jgi:hypothetical protein
MAGQAADDNMRKERKKATRFLASREKTGRNSEDGKCSGP